MCRRPVNGESAFFPAAMLYSPYSPARNPPVKFSSSTSPDLTSPVYGTPRPVLRVAYPHGSVTTNGERKRGAQKTRRSNGVTRCLSFRRRKGDPPGSIRHKGSGGELPPG